MMNDETKRQPVRVGVNSSFILLPSAFPQAGGGAGAGLLNEPLTPAPSRA